MIPRQAQVMRVVATHHTVMSLVLRGAWVFVCDGLRPRAQSLLIGQIQVHFGGEFKSHWHCCDRSFLFPAFAVLLEGGPTAHFENGIC